MNCVCLKILSGFARLMKDIMFEFKDIKFEFRVKERLLRLCFKSLSDINPDVVLYCFALCVTAEGIAIIAKCQIILFAFCFDKSVIQHA